MLMENPDSHTLLHAADSGRPLFVFFTGSWCGACRAQKPIFLAAAEAFGNAADFAIADIAREEALASECGVSRLPAVVFLLNGCDEGMLSGRFSPGQLTEFVKKSLSLAPALGAQD